MGAECSLLLGRPYWIRGTGCVRRTIDSLMAIAYRALLEASALHCGARRVHRKALFWLSNREPACASPAQKRCVFACVRWRPTSTGSPDRQTRSGSARPCSAAARTALARRASSAVLLAATLRDHRRTSLALHYRYGKDIEKWK